MKAAVSVGFRNKRDGINRSPSHNSPLVSHFLSAVGKEYRARVIRRIKEHGGNHAVSAACMAMQIAPFH